MHFLKIITPINIQEEKEKFFSSRTYNPQFKYIWENESLDEYIKSHPSKRNISLAVLSQDHNQIVSEAKQLYQTDIDNSELRNAENILKNIPDFNSITIHIHELQDMFSEAFSFLNIDYECEITDRAGFNARPNHKLRKLLISSSAVLEHMSADAIVKHEMVHICRHINKEFNNLKKKNDFLPTEEGLASYIGDFHATGGEIGYFRHAAEFAASAIGLNGSLREIYDFFVGLGFSKELAWQRGIRHKFGFKNTAKPGDILKPAIYFEFEEKIRKLSEDAIIRLFNGKFSLNDLPLHSEYKGYFEKEKLIEYFGL